MAQEKRIPSIAVFGRELSRGQAGVPFAPKHAHLQLAGASRSNSLHAAGDIGPLHLLLGRKTHLASLEGLDVVGSCESTGPLKSQIPLQTNVAQLRRVFFRHARPAVDLHVIRATGVKGPEHTPTVDDDEIWKNQIIAGTLLDCPRLVGPMSLGKRLTVLLHFSRGVFLKIVVTLAE